MNNIHILVLLLILFFILYVIFPKFNSRTFEAFTDVSKNDWLEELFDMRQIIMIPARKNNVKNFCSSMKINETVFPAIMKKDLSYNNIYKLKPGEIACALSQEQVLRNFVESKNNSLLMFEDDIMPLTNKFYTLQGTTLEHVQNYMKKSVDYLPTDWDVLYFGRCWDNCQKHVPVNKFLVKVNRAMCHHAIAFSKHGAQKILDNISHPMSKPIDHVVSGLCVKGIITCYATIVPIFYQNREELYTTIGNFDKLPICVN